jgi:amino acid transporter
LIPLIAATFFMVSGGPYGIEDVLQPGYNQALLIFVLVPIVWSLPVALLIGELAAALPNEGGFYIWVERGLGPFWGFQEAWLSLAASIFDMAIYPTIFTLYLARLWPPAAAHPVLIGGAVVAACVIWNVAGTRAVGSGSVVMGIALLAPFAVITVLAFLWSGGRSQTTPAAGAEHLGMLGAFLVAVWNYMGWDNASTIAGEVERPQRTYPLAMFGAVTLVTFCYLVPVAALQHTGMDTSSWTTGAWVEAARAVGGPALAAAVIAGGMVCGVGMFNALVLSYSRLPLAMARDRFLPAIFARLQPSTGAPWFSIIILAVAWTAVLAFGFERLVILDILLYGMSLILEFVALAALRRREPGLERPFRIPGGMPLIVLLTCGPAGVLIVDFVHEVRQGQAEAKWLLLGLGVMLAGAPLYFLSRQYQRRRMRHEGMSLSGVNAE